MSLRQALVPVLLALTAACERAGPRVITMAEADLTALHSTMDEQRARPEHRETKLQVQILLVAVTGRGFPGVQRTPEEAELRAAWLLADAAEGTPFDELVKSDSDGPWPAVETVSSETRLSRTKGLGDVLWRLVPGEIGVVPYGPDACGEGWMLVKRLQ